MDRYLKQLPAGWVKTDKGYGIFHANGSSCQVWNDGKEWLVLNIGGPEGPKWGQAFPSFKRLLAAINAD